MANMSKDGKRPPGPSGLGNGGNSPPSKRVRPEDEETPMEVDESEEESTSNMQQNPPAVSQSASGSSGDGSGASVVNQPSAQLPADSDVQKASPAHSQSASASSGDRSTASTADLPGSSGEDVETAAKGSDRPKLVARRSAARPKQQQPKYKAYSDSVVGQDVAMPGMPAKPSCFLPSNDSVQKQPAHVVPGGLQLAAPQTQPQQDPAAIVPPPPAAAGGQPVQGSAQIVIKFPDGHTEVIDVLNADDVRRVAHAGQVIRPIHGGMSSSYPQASQPHQPSTSSLPSALGAPADLPAALAPGSENVVDPADDNPIAGGGGQDVNPPAADSTAPDQHLSSAAVTKTTAAKKKKEKVKYQSHSAPSIEDSQPETKPDEKKLFSIPILGITKQLKKKVLTTLELLDMKAEIDRIAEGLCAIEEESNLSDEDNKGDKDDKEGDKE